MSEAIYRSDPERNGIEIYRNRARNAGLRQNGRIRMATGPLDLHRLTADAARLWTAAPVRSASTS